ncbi:RNA polymerase sigma factor [Lipingzhangella sp. LS1_29]|uniref:RNA polymerase sigma factor n=1 Tax=Lipingzhangella rawalii TaxID=2055835 RepID=A0ABU2H3T5_9ACTN|nr:RNA polymerase sigma factor [Lipingzhangella rawalii]MDS1269657.1 RNA polymerase sigma factor [Lipingzhangella rawalii]
MSAIAEAGGNRANTDTVEDWFVGLYDTHRALVFSAALRLCGRWPDAEDLTADTFLRAYRAAAGYTAERRAELMSRAWLMTILMNLWRNRARSQAHRPPPDRLPDDGVDEADPRQDVPGTVEQRETTTELARLLNHLPVAQREAVVLRHVLDLSTREVAEILNAPEGTVKSHVSRGLRRLRELTEGDAQ